MLLALSSSAKADWSKASACTSAARIPSERLKSPITCPKRNFQEAHSFSLPLKLGGLVIDLRSTIFSMASATLMPLGGILSAESDFLTSHPRPRTSLRCRLTSLRCEQSRNCCCCCCCCGSWRCPRTVDTVRTHVRTASTSVALLRRGSLRAVDAGKTDSNLQVASHRYATN